MAISKPCRNCGCLMRYVRSHEIINGEAVVSDSDNPDYVGSPDNLSATLNKYLRENNLFPSEDHTVYSLRHSFQDRLLATKALDREQADLMGHKFERPDYGEGVTLGQKLECLEKIRLKSI